MKDKRIDHLFREKLEGHSKLPSPLAWEKLNSELSKKEKKVGFLWWQKAAVVLLVCISGFLIFRNEKTSNGDQVASNSTNSVEEEAQPDAFLQSEIKENLHAQKTLKPETETASPDDLTPIEPREDKKLVTKAPNAERSIFLESPVVKQYVVMNAEKDQEEQSDQTNAGESKNKKEHAEAKKSPPPVSIEFRSGKRKKERTLMADVEQEATLEDPSFSFKRLVAAVKDVKSGEIGLAEIRQAKDDLFAFDTNKEVSKDKDE